MMGRNPYYTNGVGYYDSTAGEALSNIVKEKRDERRKNQMAKRSCRRTEDENRIHDKAVKMRKMTDEQLVHYVEDRVNKARSEGYNQGVKSVPPAPKVDINGIIEEIKNIKGIGIVKLQLIEAVLIARLEV